MLLRHHDQRSASTVEAALAHLVADFVVHADVIYLHTRLHPHANHRLAWARALSTLGSQLIIENSDTGKSWAQISAPCEAYPSAGVCLDISHTLGAQ